MSQSKISSISMGMAGIGVPLDSNHTSLSRKFDFVVTVSGHEIIIPNKPKLISQSDISSQFMVKELPQIEGRSPFPPNMALSVVANRLYVEISAALNIKGAWGAAHKLEISAPLQPVAMPASDRYLHFSVVPVFVQR